MAIIYKTYTTPDTFTYGSNEGWNAGANSIGLLDDNASYQFTIPGAPAGVVTGISDPEDNVGYGYTEIGYAFYISNGGYRVIEKGQFRTSPIAIPAESLFQITHIGTRVEYFVNGEHVYTSGVPSPETFMLVDASLYAAGDSIADASINEVYVQTAEISGSSTLSASPTVTRPASLDIQTGSTLAAGYTFGGTKYAVANFAGSSTLQATPGVATTASLAITTSSTFDAGTPRVHNDGGNVETQPLKSFGSNYELATAAVEFEPWTVSSATGFLEPRISQSYTQFVGLDTTGLVLTGGILSSATEFEPLDTIAADFNYGESDVSFFGMFSRGGEYAEVDGLLVADVPAVTLDALGQEQPLQGVVYEIPDVTFEGHSGGRLTSEYNVVTITASGTVPGVGRVTAEVPEVTPTVSGLVSGVAGVNRVYNPDMELTAYSGGIVTGRVPSVELSTNTQVGAVASVRVNVPLVTATIETTQANFGGVVGDVPQVVSLYGYLQEDIPEISLYAGMFAPVTHDTSYSINSENAALTTYDDYAFDYIVRFEGQHYGFIGNTMYLLSGDTDDGRRIAAEFELHPEDAGEPQLKQMPYTYISGRSDKTLIATMLADEEESTSSYEPAMDRVGAHTRRIKQARGVRAHHWAVRVSNVDGDDLDVSSMELHIDIGSRRI